MRQIIFLFFGFFAMNLTSAHLNTAYLHAQIYNGEKILPDANAFLVQDGRFISLGTVDAIKQQSNDLTTFVDLNGALVLPGFIESHAHLLGLGKSKLMLDLKGLDKKSVVDLVKAQSLKQPKNSWIKGRGWDQNLWTDQAFPESSWLKDIQHPVCLVRVDGHAIWVNDAALKIANLEDNLVDPVGGQIVRDALGRPAGVFIDTAMELINRHIALPSKEELELYLDLGMKEAVSFGITSLHDAGSLADVLNLFIAYAQQDKLLLRIYAMIDGENDQLVEHYLKNGPVALNDVLSIRSIKYFADGALGSRGALLLNDYHDQPGHKGLSLIEPGALLKKTINALNHGFQVATHAIGDGANRLVLDVYEQALKKTNSKDARLRIEHAQLIDEQDHHRFKDLAIIASMQPIHCTSDMSWIKNRLSLDRLQKRAYPWKSLLRKGALLAFGSDAPVEDINPILGLYSAVTRNDADMTLPNGFMSEEKLTLKEALDGYFSNAAFAEFAEHQKGLIKEGFLADFVVFEENILHPLKSSFIQARPIKTVMGGKVVFERQAQQVTIGNK